ncbi:MAG: PLP-dependent transferase [Candidatus Solibacter sp.]|nr:PLP-dependent transferase [Candidatus Solibacter sp.]
MNIHTKAVHSGDRKRAGGHVPVTTPIHTATSYFYQSMEQLDRVCGGWEQGYCYARHDNPSTGALEELMCALEGGDAALACASGMAALHTAILSALTDRRRSIVAADAMYGATVGLLMNVFEPAGVSVRFAGICDLKALRAVVAEAQPGCIVMESSHCSPARSNWARTSASTA